MSLWKVKFNHTDGETRRCKVCDKDFHTDRPVWRCRPCTSKYIFEKAKEKYGDLPSTGKWAGMPNKKPYPFDNKGSEASNRFCKIRTALSNAWKEYNKTGDRNVITAHYDKQLKEIEENGIMTWILDRRGNDDLPNGQTKSKSKNMIRTEYPDTRGYYEK
jgi:hypothetical protein